MRDRPRSRRRGSVGAFCRSGRLGGGAPGGSGQNTTRSTDPTPIARGLGTLGGAADNRSVVEAELQTRRTPADSIAIGRSLARPDAFSVIFDRHFRGVHRYLSRRVGRELADDLASATFTIAFERRRSFRTESDSAFPWLLGIATNLLRNHRRSEQRALEAVARLGETSVVFAGELTGDDRDVAGALARLDPDQRDVLFLYVWGRALL
jgi:DNA-directed RNA polymerase specialized sigma24 family protein